MAVLRLRTEEKRRIVKTFLKRYVSIEMPNGLSTGTRIDREKQFEKQRSINIDMIQFKTSLVSLPWNVNNPAKILRRMTPTLIEQMLYLGIPFANQWSICLRCCYVFNTKQLSCRNIISSSGLYKTFFLSMKTGSTQITFRIKIRNFIFRRI